MISLIRFARLIRPRPPNSAFGLRQWLLRGLPSANLISGNQANLRSREAFSLSWLCRTGILSCVLLYRLSKTVCFLESSLPIHRRTRPSPHSDDSGNFHGPVCAGSTRRSHCLRPRKGRVWRSGADQPRERARKFPRFREGEGFVLRTLLHTYYKFTTHNQTAIAD